MTAGEGRKRRGRALSKHARNVAPMTQSPRCGAKTRAGGECRAPAVAGRRRCRMHGGAAGSGAPRGNQNALKTGLHTAKMIFITRRVNALRRNGARVLRSP